MTLEEHFGLTQPPFPKAATELSLLRHSALQEILDKLRFALSRDTIALLVAESGCGKSTTLVLFAKSLDAGSYHVLAPSLTPAPPLRLLPHLPPPTRLHPSPFN